MRVPRRCAGRTQGRQRPGGWLRRVGDAEGSVRTLIATSTACVLLAIPTTTEPCFTASAAYSTWNIRPCGELKRWSAGSRKRSSGLKGRDRCWSLQCDRVVVVVVSEHDGGSCNSRSRMTMYRSLLWVSIERMVAGLQCSLAGCWGIAVVWFGLVWLGASFRWAVSARQLRAASPRQGGRY